MSGSGTISASGQLDDWQLLTHPAGGELTITGTPDATLWFEMLVINPNQIVVAVATALSAGQTVALLDVPMSLTGIYTIRVDGRNHTLGSYTLSVAGNSDASVHSLPTTVAEPTTMNLLALASALMLFYSLVRRHTSQSHRAQRLALLR